MKELVSTMKENGNLTWIIVDEAHCVDIYGSDFCPTYSELHSFKEIGV